MKWTGDPRTDLRLSFMDDTETVILAQAIKAGAAPGWNGFDYSMGEIYPVGYFDTVEQAKLAVEMSVNARTKVTTK